MTSPSDHFYHSFLINPTFKFYLSPMKSMRLWTKWSPIPIPHWLEERVKRGNLERENEGNLYKQKSIIHFLPKRSERAPKMTPPTCVIFLVEILKGANLQDPQKQIGVCDLYLSVFSRETQNTGEKSSRTDHDPTEVGGCDEGGEEGSFTDEVPLRCDCPLVLLQANPF